MRYPLAVIVAVVRFVFVSVGWEIEPWVGGTVIVKDNRGHRWRITCEAVDP